MRISTRKWLVKSQHLIGMAGKESSAELPMGSTLMKIFFHEGVAIRIAITQVETYISVTARL